MAGNTALSNILSKKKKETSSGPAPVEEKKKKRYITLSTGAKVELEDLSEEDRKRQREFLKRGNLRQQRYVRMSQYPSTFIAPEYIRKALEHKETEKQRRYRRNVVDMATLTKPTPKKVKSNNRQKLDRYVLWTEMVACKNGFLYYTLPLLVSLAFFIISLTRNAFWVNFLFSLSILLNCLAVAAIWKESSSAVKRGLLLLLLFAIDVGVVFLLRQYPELLEGLKIGFALKMVLIVFSIYHFGKFYVQFAKMYAQDCKSDFGNTVLVKAGKPRCGKTSSAVHEAIILAKLKWQELQFDFWKAISEEETIIKSGDVNRLLELHEIKIAYNFYVMRPCIPCLWSNIGVFDKHGRASHKITLDHIKGLERLPVYSVVLLDEIGAMLKADDGLNRVGVEKPLDISDMFRLGGHFVKWTVIGCEQDFNHIFIDFRRVVGFNQVIQGQEWTCKPKLFYGIYKFLKFLKVDGMDRTVKKSKRYGKFLIKFERFVKSIGFRKIKYGFASNTETNAGMVAGDNENAVVKLTGEKYRLVPSTLAGNYDDRAYKQKYASYFDKEIKGALHKYKFIDTSDENTAVFVNSTKSLLEKREAQKNRIVELSCGSVDKNAG